MSNCEDTLEIELDIDATGKDAYTELSLFDYISDNDTLRLVLDPFEVYPEERMLELLQIVEQRKSARASHEDWLADDLGEGYDREDPFIDDSEAPQEVLGITTRFGGFYVSKGDVEIVNDKLIPVEGPEDPTLPDHISPSLRREIDEFVRYHDELSQKENVWSDEPALDLLKAINEGLFNLSSTLRGRIISYLSHRLKVKKAYFLKKLRKIRNSSVNKALMDKALDNLRQYVQGSMPQQLQRWFDTTEQLESSNGAADVKRSLKKSFQWTSDGVRLLHELVRLELEHFSSTDPIVENLQNFLEKMVKPLWPKGWVTINGLTKECLPLLPPNTVIRKKRKLSPSPTTKPKCGNSSIGCSVRPPFSAATCSTVEKNVFERFADDIGNHHSNPNEKQESNTALSASVFNGRN